MQKARSEVRDQIAEVGTGIADLELTTAVSPLKSDLLLLTFVSVRHFGDVHCETSFGQQRH